MKISSTLITLIFSTSLLISQEPPKLHPAFSVTPQLTKFNHPGLNGKPKPGFGINLEAILVKSVSDHFQLGFGMSFQHATLRQMGVDYRWPSEVENGEYKPSKDDINDYEVTYSSLGIPVTGRLYLGKKTNRFVFSGCGSLNYIVSADHHHIFQEPGSMQATIFDGDFFGIEIRKLYLTLGAGVGYELGFGQHHRIAVGPHIEYNISEFIKSGNVTNQTIPRGKPLFVGFRLYYSHQRA